MRDRILCTLSVIEIDRDHDLAYILLRPELRGQHRSVAKSIRVAEDIVLDLDENGQLIGIELLNASSRLDLDKISEGTADLIVGVKEAAEMLGIEKSNFVRDHANKSQFPVPIAELASGRFWLVRRKPMRAKLTAALLALAIAIAGNIVQAIEYRKLYYDAAQAEGLLDEANHYIHTLCWNNER